jgi:hypothetical protein
MTISNQIISFKLSGISYTGNNTQLNFTAGVTAGTCIASKALVVDSYKTITGISSLTSDSLIATSLTGTLQTTSQPNITSVGTLSGLTVNNNLSVPSHNGSTSGLLLGAILVTANGTQLNYNRITSPGTAEASKTLVLDSSRNISNINSLTVSSLITTNLTINGTSLNISGTQLNYNNITTPGIAEASKTLVLNSSSNITNINSLTATSLIGTNLTGTITTVAQPNITSVGILTSLVLSGAITGLTDLTLSGNISGASSISATSLVGTITTASQPNITSLGTLGNLTISGSLTTSLINVTTISLGGTNIVATANNINTLAGVVAGTATASKTLILDASRNITNINSLTATAIVATNLTGTLQIAAQPNITSLGILTSLVLNGTISGITDLSMNGTLSGASVVSATTLTGLLSTAAQTNVTSLGTLSSLKVSGNVALGTSTASMQLEINNSLGNCLRLSYNAPTGSASNYSDITISNAGNLQLSPSGTLTYVNSDLIIGKSTTENKIRFNGVSGDPGINMTIIAERLYGISDFSELLLFKGNDIVGSSGPDRIRLRSSEIRFQIYTSVEDYTTLGDNNDRMIISSTGRVGINTTSPDKQLEINSATGNCLRLSYNDNDGSATNYSDLSINSSGILLCTSSNNSVVIGDVTDTPQTLFIGAYNNTSTTGLIKITNSGGINYIQSGLNNTTGSTTDLFIGDIGQSILNSSRKFMFKSDGKFGIGTYAPDRQVEINDTNGNCLRLSYNDSNGSAVTYCDQTITTSGIMTFTVAGSSPSFLFTGGNIAGILSTNAQPNITSLGTLTSLTLSGAVSGITNLAMSGNLTGATSITATNLIGTITLASQNNITSVGPLTNLNIVGNTKMGIVASSPQDILHIEGNINDFIGLQIENRNSTAVSSGSKLSFTGFSSTVDNFELARIACITTDSGTSSSYQYGSLAFYTRNTSLSTNADERMRIMSSGNVVIGATTTSYKLEIVGTSKTNQLLVGTSTDTTSTRLISALDSAIGTSTRFITLGKANSSNNQFEIGYTHVSDGSTTNLASFGFKDQSSTSKLYMLPTGNIGIGTNSPNRQLEINQPSTTYGMRMTYNTTSNLTDLGVGSDGTFNIVSSNNTLLIGSTSDLAQSLILGANGSITTSGILKITNISGINYIQSGINNTIGSAADLIISNYGQNISNSSRKIIIKGNGNVGFGQDSPQKPLEIYNNTTNVFSGFSSTYNNALRLSSGTITTGIASNYIDISLTSDNSLIFTGGNPYIGINTLYSPQKNLEINSVSGDCLRLTYNSTVNCVDLLVTSGGDLSLTPYGGNINITTHNGSTTGLKLNNILVTATATKLNYTDVTTIGIAQASKALVLNSSSSISGITSLTTTTLNASKILVGTSTDTGRLISALDSTMTNSSTRQITLGKANSNNNQFEIQYKHISDGSNSNYCGFGLYGNTDILTVVGNSRVGINTATPSSPLDIITPSNVYGIKCGDGTVTLATYTSNTTGQFGTVSNHNLQFFTNNGIRATLTTNGYLGISTSSPSVPLHVNTSTSFASAAGWGYRSNGSSSSGATATQVSAIFSGDLVCNAMYAVSDRRLKYDFKELSNDFCKDFIFKNKPVEYKFKTTKNKINYGYIAQEIYKSGYENLISFVPHENLDEEIDDDGFISMKNEKMIITYEGIIPILAKNIEILYKENEEHVEIINELKNENNELRELINNLARRLDKLE